MQCMQLVAIQKRNNIKKNSNCIVGGIMRANLKLKEDFDTFIQNFCMTVFVGRIINT